MYVCVFNDVREMMQSHFKLYRQQVLISVSIFFTFLL